MAVLQADEIADLVHDATPWAFYEFLQIEDRGTKQWVSYDPCPEQRDWTECMLVNGEAIDLKGRNIGIGVATQTFHFWRAWRAAWLGLGINTLVVAHAGDTAQRHLERYKSLNSRLPDELRLDVASVHGGDNATDYKLIVPGTTKDYAWFRAVTAGGKKGEGKGFTQQQLHITEYAFWEKDHYGSLTSAMHRSEWFSVAIESTPTGGEGHFSARYWQAKKNKEGSGNMVARFYPWTMQPSFVAPVPEDWKRTEDEHRLAREHHLTDEQLAWRRRKMGGAEDPPESIVLAFQDDYPLTEEEAFRSKKKEVFFSQSKITEMLAPWVSVLDKPKGERVFADPTPHGRYAVYLDPAGGVGADATAICVVSNTGEQVYAWDDRHADGIEGADRAVKLAIRYNNALLDVDDNTIGQAALYRIRDLRYRRTNGATIANRKRTLLSQVMGYAALQIEQGRCLIHDYWTLKDLQEMPPGLVRRSNSNSQPHWDNGTAFIYALWLAQKLEDEERLRSQTIRDRFQQATTTRDRYSSYR